MKKVSERLLWDALRLGNRPNDAELLEAFLARRDPSAFEMLIGRHGPMVFGVCRRVLGNRHDAEDAFQATFLVLLRKADGIRPRERVGNWLYGVAYRTALAAKVLKIRRQAKERRAARPEAHIPAAMPELSPVIDQEIRRLPEKYRLPVVLCDLEERSPKDVALQLGWKEGTLSGRLSRARGLLAKRLARRGITAPAATLAAVLSDAGAEASGLIRTATQTVLLIAAGQTTPSAPVAELVQGVLRAMFMTRLEIAAAAMAILIAAGAITSGVMHRTQAAEKDVKQWPDFTGKMIVVFGKEKARTTTISRVEFTQLGDRQFIVGEPEKNQNITQQLPVPAGTTIWVPILEIESLWVLPGPKQEGSKK
jgi:RNA polymerase sigma-70 factor (ECF subfamily)